MKSVVLLIASAALAMNNTMTGPHYRDNNENGALDKDTWETYNGMWRTFLRLCRCCEDSSFILQGLRDVDDKPLINCWRIWNWSQWRCLPTEAGKTAQDNAEWLEIKLKAVQDGAATYEKSETANRAQSYGPEGEQYRHAAEEYRKLKERANAALPLLKRVHAYFTRKAWTETLFAYIRGSHARQHTQLQYTDPSNIVHNYDVVEDKTVTNNSKIVFERSSGESCCGCPDRLVLSEQFANKHHLTGTDKEGKPMAMHLYYNVENGWRVHYNDDRWFNNKNVTVKFLNFQDANPMVGGNYTNY